MLSCRDDGPLDVPAENKQKNKKAKVKTNNIKELTKIKMKYMNWLSTVAMN